ncbi:LOW QUALITY PROTEIN: ADP-ribosylation factor-binding protein GGA3 [Geothlypis trichas]
MAETEGDLESWLNKATNPSNRQEDWEYIIGFCDQINKELEGPQIAVRLLAHKIQSPQEWEAVQALTVLEACMKNCGRRFHNEVGKFRFLNELIKVVSPKYLGDRVSEKVKSKVIELLYSWTVALPEESKIKDAYYMLKRQGIVMFDPVIPADRTLIPSPPPRPKNPVFDDEEKSKLLAKLLKSKNPDDLQEANKLIKSMVKEDEARIQKVTKRMHTLEEVNNNVKLLNEMLVHYSKEDSSEADRELMKELYERCETKRRTLFKLASETEDNDSSLGDILQASDNLSRVINSYKKIIEGQVINGEVDLPGMSVVEGSNSTNNLNTLIDLAGLDVSSAPPPPLPPRSLAAAPSAAPGPAEIPVLPPPPQAFVPPRSSSAGQGETAPAQQGSTTNSLSLLDEELLCLGLNDPAPAAGKETSENNQWSMFENDQLDLDFFNPKMVTVACNPAGNPLLHHPSQTTCGTSATLPSAFPASQPAPSIPAPNSAPFVFPAVPAAPAGPPKNIPAAPGYFSSSVGGSMSHKMDALGQLLEESKGSATQGMVTPSVFPGVTLPTTVTPAPLAAPAGLAATASGAPPAPFPSCPAGSGSPLFQPTSFQQQGSPMKAPEISLANVHVPLESIKPSSALPVTAYDKNGFRILLHFARECPPGRPDVLVVVVSMLNTAPLPVRNIVLQAAVPKSMKVKLQPPSGTELSPFNPIQPPAAITQVMLLANPAKEKVRLRYRLTFTLGDQPSTEVGEVDQFPPVEQWGNL